MSDDSDITRRPARLDRSVLGITVAGSLISGAFFLGTWLTSRDADRQAAVVAKIAEVQEVFARRAADQAASQVQAIAELRVLIERTRSEILAAVQASGERVSLLERQHGELRGSAVTDAEFAAWIFAFKNKNHTLDVPAAGK